MCNEVFKIQTLERLDRVNYFFLRKPCQPSRIEILRWHQKTRNVSVESPVWMAMRQDPLMSKFVKNRACSKSSRHRKILGSWWTGREGSVRPNTARSMFFQSGIAIDCALDPCHESHDTSRRPAPQMRSEILHPHICTSELHVGQIYLRRSVVVQVRARDVSVNFPQHTTTSEEIAALSTNRVASGQHRISHDKDT